MLIKYCRLIEPKSSLFTSILGLKPKPMTRAVWGGKNTIKGTHISEWPSQLGSWEHNKVRQGQRSPWISKVEIRTSSLPSEMTFCEVLQDTDKHCQYKVWREVLKYLRSPRISKADVQTSGLPSEMTFRVVLQDTDKHCQYKVWREVLKYLRGKL